jgi:hypothetical protein
MGTVVWVVIVRAGSLWLTAVIFPPGKEKAKASGITAERRTTGDTKEYER